MYLVDDFKARLLIITDSNPRDEGYQDQHFFRLYADIDIEHKELLEASGICACLGKRSDRSFCVFVSPADCRKAGVEIMEGSLLYYPTWRDFCAARDTARSSKPAS
jgi:hypothetical protein